MSGCGWVLESDPAVLEDISVSVVAIDGRTELVGGRAKCGRLISVHGRRPVCP